MFLPHQFRRSVVSRLAQARSVSSYVDAFPRTVASLLIRSNAHVDHDIGVTKSSSDHDTSQVVTVHGWVRSVRRMKNVSFVHVADGSTTTPLQAVLTGEQSEGYFPPPAVLRPSQGLSKFHCRQEIRNVDGKLRGPV